MSVGVSVSVSVRVRVSAIMIESRTSVLVSGSTHIQGLRHERRESRPPPVSAGEYTFCPGWGPQPDASHSEEATVSG